MKKSRSQAELKHLGLGQSDTIYQFSYDKNFLESFNNKNPSSKAWTTFICPEFTSLCPKTGQPDFAKIFINYIADKKMIESKSVKLYLFSFRNHGDFHEDCIQTICNDIVNLIKPFYIEVMGEFTPRGGISIFPFASWSQKSFEKLKQDRFTHYSPGKYSVTLDRVYR